MRLLARRVLLSLVSLLPLACSAAEAPAAAKPATMEFKEDVQYKRVPAEQKPADAKRVEVDEFFWYGCPHCYHLDPEVSKWLKTKPADVDFVRVPNSLGRPEGILHSKAFYTAEALGLGDKMHRPLFDAIHKDHKPITTEAELQAFFTSESGVLPDVFTSTFRGFAVDSRVRRAEDMAKAYSISSVPAVVVGGKYYTNGTLAGDFPKMMLTIDFLINKVRQERKAK
jgi:thiol:disulfide interchange protein DsbA